MDWKFWRRSAKDRDLDEEIAFDLAADAADRLHSGLSPEEALRASRRDFGNVLLVKESTRETWGSNALDRLLQDVRYAFRQMARSPGFSLVALASLAFGVGANTAVFTLADTVLWKMLPVRHPGQLVFLERFPGVTFGGDKKFCDISYPLMEEFERRDPLLDGATSFDAPQSASLAAAGETGPARVMSVAPDFYSLLGVNPAAGRLLQPADQGVPVAVLSYGYWQRRFGSQASALGSSITINGSPFTIVGVAPSGFSGVMPGSNFDVSVPFTTQAMDAAGVSPVDLRGPRLLWVLARLKPGVTSAQAAESLTTLLHQMLRQDPASHLRPESTPNQHIVVTSANRGINRLRELYAAPLAALLALVAVVLLITCANLAGLTASRAAARRRELTIRAAIGAGRARLVHQLLTESLVLSLAGGLLAIPVAHLTLTALLHIVSATALSGSQNIALQAAIDLRAMVFLAGASVVTGILCGFAAAWNTSRDGTPSRSLGLASPRLAGARSRFTSSLVTLQVASSLVLLVGAGLFIRSLHNLASLDPGFRRDHILLVSIDPRLGGLTGASLPASFRQILHRVSAIPGVLSVSMQRNTPLRGSSSLSGISVPGFLPPPGEEASILVEAVGPRYFTTLGIHLLTGRDFRDSDHARSSHVAVLNLSAARHYFHQDSPLGRRFGRNSETPLEYEVTGVVPDILQRSLRQPTQPTVYVSALQDPLGWRDTTLQVHTAVPPLTLANAVRQAVRDADPRVPVMAVTTLEDVAEGSVSQERLIALLSSLYGLLALALVSVGLGGLLSMSVSRRTNEIGVRMALGARRAAVVAMILRQALALVILGIALGLPLALVAARAAGSLFFGLGPADPLVITLAVLTITLVATLAAFWPARRAGSVDPIAALRSD